MVDNLRKALAAIHQSREAHLDACSAAWMALREVDPELAAVISGMWANDDVAAEWICKPYSHDLSPAEMVLAGRSDLVRSIILKAEHGFCA